MDGDERDASGAAGRIDANRPELMISPGRCPALDAQPPHRRLQGEDAQDQQGAEGGGQVAAQAAGDADGGRHPPRRPW